MNYISLIVVLLIASHTLVAVLAGRRAYKKGMLRGQGRSRELRDGEHGMR